MQFDNSLNTQESRGTPIRATSTHALVEQLRQQRDAQAYGIKQYQLPRLCRTNEWLILVTREQGDGTLSLLVIAKEEPRMRLQQGFTEQEILLLLPLLDHYPDYCPYDVLLAHFYATPTETQIAHYQQEVVQAMNAGTLGVYLRYLRGFLSRTRLKLRLFGIEISGLFETGYELRSVTDHFKEGVTDDLEADER